MSTSAAKPEIPGGYSVCTEGQASILQKGSAVFYNEAQVNSTADIGYVGVDAPPHSRHARLRSLIETCP